MIEGGGHGVVVVSICSSKIVQCSFKKEIGDKKLMGGFVACQEGCDVWWEATNKLRHG